MEAAKLRECKGRMEKRLVCLVFDAGPNQTIEVSEGTTFSDLRANYVKDERRFWVHLKSICFAVNDENDRVLSYDGLCGVAPVPVYEKCGAFVLVSSELDPEQVELIFSVEGLGKVSLWVAPDKKECLRSKLESRVGFGLKVTEIVGFGEDAAVEDVIEAAKEREIVAGAVVSEECSRFMERRVECLNEIVSGERRFVEELEQIWNYWKPRVAALKKFNSEEMDLVFREIDTILDGQEGFLEGLEAKVSGFDSAFGSVFLEYLPSFKRMLAYVEMYPEIVKVVNGKKVGDELQKLAEACGGKDLLCCLKALLERLRSYGELVHNLLEQTPEWHLDHSSLVQADRAIRGVVRKTDRAFALVNPVQVLEELQVRNKDVFQFSLPSRHVLELFDVWIVTKTRNRGALYVCNDVVFLVDENGDIVFDTNVCRFHFLPVDDPQTIVVSCLNEKYIHNHGNARKEFTIEFESVDEKDRAMKVISEAAKAILDREDYKKVITWELLDASSKAPARSQASGVFFDGKLYLWGGVANNGKTILSDFVIYDLEHKTCVRQGGSTTGRTEHTMTLLNGKFYLIGGKTRKKKCVPIDIFDPATNTWTQSKCQKLTSVSRHTSVVYNNKIYVFGGHGLSELTNELVVYDPDNDTVCEVIVTDTRPPPRCGHSAVVFQHYMVIFGGRSETDALGDLWFLDFNTMQWTKKGDFPRRVSHQAFMFGEEMIAIGGHSDTPERVSMSILLGEDCQLDSVHDTGNVPVGFHSFTAVIGEGVDIYIYGGKESKMMNPVQSIYRLRLNREWLEQVLKKEMDSPPPMYSPQRDSKKPVLSETSPIKFSPGHEAEPVRSLILSDSDGEDQKEEFFFENPPNEKPAIPLSPLSRSDQTPATPSPRQKSLTPEIKLEITETVQPRGQGIPKWSIREVEDSEVEDSDPDLMSSPIKMKKPETEQGTASVLLTSFKQAMNRPAASVASLMAEMESDDEDLKERIDEFLGDYVRSGSPLKARCSISTSPVAISPVTKKQPEQESPTPTRKKWMPDSIKKYGSPAKPGHGSGSWSPRDNDRFRLTPREAAQCERATRLMFAGKNSPLKRPPPSDEGSMKIGPFLFKFRSSHVTEEEIDRRLSPRPRDSSSTSGKRFTFFTRD